MASDAVECFVNAGLLFQLLLPPDELGEGKREGGGGVWLGRGVSVMRRLGLAVEPFDLFLHKNY